MGKKRRRGEGGRAVAGDSGAAAGEEEATVQERTRVGAGREAGDVPLPLLAAMAMLGKIQSIIVVVTVVNDQRVFFFLVVLLL